MTATNLEDVVQKFMMTDLDEFPVRADDAFKRMTGAAIKRGINPLGLLDRTAAVPATGPWSMPFDVASGTGGTGALSLNTMKLYPLLFRKRTFIKNLRIQCTAVPAGAVSVRHGLYNANLQGPLAFSSLNLTIGSLLQDFGKIVDAAIINTTSGMTALNLDYTVEPGMYLYGIAANVTGVTVQEKRYLPEWDIPYFATGAGTWTYAQFFGKTVTSAQITTDGLPADAATGAVVTTSTAQAIASCPFLIQGYVSDLVTTPGG